MSDTPSSGDPFQSGDTPPPGAGLPPIGEGAPPPQPGAFGASGESVPPGPYGAPGGGVPPGAQGPTDLPPGSYPTWQQPPQVVVVEKNNTTKIILIVVIALLVVPCLLAVVSILAVTFLGRSASSRFSSVGSAVRDVKLMIGASVVLLHGWKLVPDASHRSWRRLADRSAGSA